MVPVYNKTAEPIIIKKGTKVGRITPTYGEEAAQWISQETFARIANDATVNFADLTEDFAMTIETAEEETETTDKVPPIPKEVPNYGISKPDIYPVITDLHGVEICADDPKFAEKLRDLLNQYHIYHDRGMIPIPDEEKMRIELIDGWQNQKSRIKVFPLGLEDMEFLNEEMEKQHKKGKAGWQIGPAALACSIFIVWKYKEDGTKGKGRVVVDMRPLNKWASPDVYPLPDQEDIMQSLRGKKRITMFDASGFFHQLGVYPQHRNRMVMISPRGLSTRARRACPGRSLRGCFHDVG
ncbi:hypothetical protein CSUB01_12682 [Colletotrichum sublineola]|uniref:Uncharacterized protein n=1 Tax=Colletotrichum sublineola TaxID=1173701 RepID=A0A066XKQ9_COLSU|nr:hypothetical protein CSUB01_12682 [Colletotrichum sublineola]